MSDAVNWGDYTASVVDERMGKAEVLEEKLVPLSFHTHYTCTERPKLEPGSPCERLEPRHDCYTRWYT